MDKEIEVLQIVIGKVEDIINMCADCEEEEYRRIRSYVNSRYDVTLPTNRD